jgi:membrane protein
MVAFAQDRRGWAAVRGRHLVARIGQLELLDRSYTLAAQSFVALLPLILAIAAAFTSPGSNLVAQELVSRFGLVGAAARSVQDLIVVQMEGIYWTGLILTIYAAFTLSKRASRAYNAIWGTPQLPIRDQWRSIVWVVVQVGMILLVTELRDLARESGPALAILAAAATCWSGRRPRPGRRRCSPGGTSGAAGSCSPPRSRPSAGSASWRGRRSCSPPR